MGSENIKCSEYTIKGIKQIRNKEIRYRKAQKIKRKIRGVN
jgi:hypothetical protein